MKRFLDIVVAIAISFETVVVVSCVAASLWLGDPIATLGARMQQDAELVRWLALLPVGLLGFTVMKHKWLLLPRSESTKALRQWPKYHMIQDRYGVALVWLLLSSAVTIYLWATAIDFASVNQFVWFFGAIMVSLVATGTVFWAGITLDQILAVHD